ncbi:MAG: hypothetical protein ISS45_07100 [Candidatus Omnitrophica bacterium]|nr:hypothetical protein [Candidatus Omnitrophota bacterium]
MESKKISAKKQWLFSLGIVISLTIGSSLMFHIEKLTIKIFNISAISIQDFMLNAKEGAILVAVEMGIIPIFAVIIFALFNKWSLKQTCLISWKIFIIGALLGAVIGSTYTLDYQSLACGILH